MALLEAAVELNAVWSCIIAGTQQVFCMAEFK